MAPASPSQRPPRPRCRLAVATAAVSGVVIVAVTAAVPAVLAAPRRSPAPWTWDYLGGDFGAAPTPTPRSSGVPPSVPADDGGVASWVTPAGLYTLLHPVERPRATELRRWEPAEGYWATVGVTNPGARGKGNGGGWGAVPPVAVAGAATASDTAGVAGDRMWLWGGVRTADPVGPSDGLYEFTPAAARVSVRSQGKWRRLAGSAPSDGTVRACNAATAPAPCAGAPGGVLVFAPAAGSLYLLLPSVNGAAGLVLWRFGLGGSAGTGWSRVVPGGTPPPASKSMVGTALAAVARNDTLVALWRPTAAGTAQVWSVQGLWTAVPRWRRHTAGAASAAAALLLMPYGRFWDGDRFLLGYVPGSMATASGGPPAIGDGSTDGDADGGGLPGLTVGRNRDRGAPGRGANRPLADVDRWVVLDVATLAAAAIEAPSMPHNESALAVAEAAAAVDPPPKAYGGYYDDGGEDGGPPTEGTRVLLGGSPLRRVAPHTGGGMVRVVPPPRNAATAGGGGGGGDGGDAGDLLVGHLAGGTVGGWPSVGLLRVVWRHDALIAAVGGGAD